VNTTLGSCGWRPHKPKPNASSPKNLTVCTGKTANWPRGRKHDPGKVQIAQRLRKETTLSVKQIAERLHFGTAKSASFRLLTTMKTENAANPAQTHLGF